MDDEISRTLSQLVRVGVVTSVDKPGRKCRCKFPDLGYTSAELIVLNTTPVTPDYDVPQRTEYEGPAGTYPMQYERHKHDVKLKQWMPNVGDSVLTLYLPVENGAGFVLGGI